MLFNANSNVNINAGSITTTANNDGDTGNIQIFNDIPKISLGSKFLITAGSDKANTTITEQSNLAGKKYIELKDHQQHTYVYSVKVFPTATSKGEGQGICECGQDPISFELPALNDASYAKVHYEPTAERDGYDEYTYNYNGNEVKFIISFHTYIYSVKVFPTATATGEGQGICNCGQDPISFELPALNDASYAKVYHEPTTERDGYDEYTYMYSGNEIEFIISLDGTKLPTPGGNDDPNPPIPPTPGGDDNRLSGGAIAGIVIGGTFGLLIIAYLFSYFFLYRKHKLDDKKISGIYSFLSKNGKNVNQAEVIEVTENDDNDDNDENNIKPE